MFDSWVGGFPGEGHSNPLQYSCLGNPWAEDPGRLQSIGSQRLGHNFSDSTMITIIMAQSGQNYVGKSTKSQASEICFLIGQCLAK